MRIKIKTLETNKVIIRNMHWKDLEDFHNYAIKEDVGPNAGWAPHKNLAETEYILKLFKKNKNVWAIESKIDNKMIGTFSYKQISKNAVEIGYALDSSYWNLGIMTDVVNVMVRYLFTNPKVHEIVCGHLPKNIGSKRVIEKNNFKITKIMDYLNYDGTIHEAWYYTLRREDL